MKTISISLAVCLLTLSVQVTAQTVYKQEEGFYTPVINTFYMHGGGFENATHIGTMVGYRFGGRYDVGLHTEFLTSSFTQGKVDFSLVHLGLLGGYTRGITENIPLWFRFQLAAYRTFMIKECEGCYPEMAAVSISATPALYYDMPVLSWLTFYPNAGFLTGIGNYSIVTTTTDLAQAIDFFIFSPQLGLDTKLEISSFLSVVLKTRYWAGYKGMQSISDNKFQVMLRLNF